MLTPDDVLTEILKAGWRFSLFYSEGHKEFRCTLSESYGYGHVDSPGFTPLEAITNAFRSFQFEQKAKDVN